MSHISLVPVTKANWQEVLRLSVFPEQEKFVPSTVLSLAKAYVRPDGPPIFPNAIYATGKLVGFFNLTVDVKTADVYWISGFLIDKSVQRRGYGNAALMEVLGMIFGTYPRCQSVGLTVHPDNAIARHLYEKTGFKNTGQLFEGEMIYRLRVRRGPPSAEKEE